MVSPSRKNALNSVEFRSILRIRPLMGKERDDQVVLEPLEDGTTAVLHPPVMKEGEATFLNALVSGQDLEFRFDRVLSEDVNQEKTYSVVAQPMALQAMEPFKHFSESAPEVKLCIKNQLLICMGLPNSGSSFTCTGPISKRKNAADGLLPRLFESLFLQSHHINSISSHKGITFGIFFTAMQVNQSKTNSHDCHLYKLVKPASNTGTYSIVSTKNGLTEGELDTLLEDKKSTMDDSTYKFPVFCSSVKCARDYLNAALQRGRQSRQKKVQSHLFISVQPIIVSQKSGRILNKGGNVSFLEMTGFDSKQQATRSREASRLDAHTAIMHCLKTIRHNQVSVSGHRKIPFLQHKVTELLVPLFSKKNPLSVCLMVTASPSIRDYSEKKCLLSEVKNLCFPPPAVDAFTGLSSISNFDKSQKTSRNQLRNGQGNVEILHNNRTTISPAVLPDDYPGNLRQVLPPPIVPGFTERNVDLIEPSLTKATAPMENRIFLESAIARSERCSTANRSIEGGDYSSFSGDFIPESRINYLNTIDKVIYPSEKKGCDILKNITATSGNTESSHGEEQRFSELENQKGQLLFEMQELYVRNQELEDRIHKRSEFVPPNGVAASTVATHSTNVCIFNQFPSKSVNTSEISNKKEDSLRSTKYIVGLMSEDCAEKSTFSQRIECPVGLKENALIQFIAESRAKNIIVENSTRGNDSQGRNFEDPFKAESADEKDFLWNDETSNGSSIRISDDPLMMHIAMMNSYR